MAGWSKIADGSALDSLKTLGNLQKPDFCSDIEPGSKGSLHCAEEDKLRCLFDQILGIFFKQICGNDSFRPLPPMIGDGQSVDLFKLYLLVREKGGYDSVSKNGLWDSVAQESGLGSGVGSAVKLVYVNYLDRLDRRLREIVKDKDSHGSSLESGTNRSGALMELESQFTRAFPSGFSHLDSHSIELDVTQNVCNGNGNMISVASTVEFSDRKRKRECHQQMLKWVVEVAKNPCNPEVGSLPDRCKWKCYGTDQLWKQVLLAREVIFPRRHADVTSDQANSYWMMKQSMHPSMYDDHTGSKKPRCSGRLRSAKESRASSSRKSLERACSESSSGSHSNLEDSFNKESNTFSADSVAGLFSGNYDSKRVRVDPFFQANVPEWTGETCVSDSKWLGTRVWPLESKEHTKHLIERDRIGKGRQESCGCQHPGSVQCVRFHVSEKRKRVKLELGSAFHHWKFDRMGGEVAVSWTAEEEKRFRAVIRSNPPSLGKCFWDEIFKSFPSKSREDLVSYYFNVYLLERRGGQNRSTPSNIDSDDEESEFALLSNRFGHRAAKSAGSIFHSPKKPHLNSVESG